VAAGGTCSILVTFSPTASGNQYGTLTIANNAGNTASTQTVTLEGGGLAAPGANLSTTSLTFADEPLLTASAGRAGASWYFEAGTSFWNVCRWRAGCESQQEGLPAVDSGGIPDDEI
jgi:hypothetical protein